MLTLIEHSVLLMLLEQCEKQKQIWKYNTSFQGQKLLINYSIQILYPDHPPTHIINVLILIINTPLSYFNIVTELKMELFKKLW